MDKQNLYKTLKIIIIVLLLMMITLLAVIQWKSDLIIRKVIAAVQTQLVDTLQYSDAGLDWFRHFPSSTIHISDLKLGSGKQPLLHGGEIDIVIRVLPLLRDKIIINRLHVTHSNIAITKSKERWSYELFKKSESSSDTSFHTLIEQLVIENTILKYHDGKNSGFQLEIILAKIKGGYEGQKLDVAIDMNSILSDLVMTDYTQVELLHFDLTGKYKFDFKTGLQDFKDWAIQIEEMTFTGGGTILRKSDHEIVDVALDWKKVNPEFIKKWLPGKMAKTWDAYIFSGESEGNIKIKGRSSQEDTPQLWCNAVLKKGGIDFGSETENIQDLALTLNYNSGDEKLKETSSIEIDFSKSSLFGKALEGKATIVNVKNPLLSISCKGTLPAGLLNMLSTPGLHFDKGAFEIDHFELKDFRMAGLTFLSFLGKGRTSITGKDVQFNYLNNTMQWSDGNIKLQDGKLEIDLDQLAWNSATVSDLVGIVEAKENQLDFTLKGKLCEGDIETKGLLSSIDLKPIFVAQWKVKSIEMKQLLQSFSDFDQTFITSDHLSGKADIWAESTIPFDEKWNIITKKIQVKSALFIREGQLKGMKTLEDFSKYVHLDDLRDIRFNQFRNYMKIEDGKVFLPVMFIQSNAINMSISGVHSFDQKILYNLKLNAGQTAANKLKKSDVRKDFKQARKSGWINMYFVLEGTTSNVKYQQYRTAVISGFEQSAALKESLRNELVERFGYDVYWLEPNEWEDIPEYK